VDWKLLRHTRGQKTGLVEKKKLRNYCTAAEDRKQDYSTRGKSPVYYCSTAEPGKQD
jgi:hypothetical protein